MIENSGDREPSYSVRSESCERKATGLVVRDGEPVLHQNLTRPFSVN